MSDNEANLRAIGILLGIFLEVTAIASLWFLIALAVDPLAGDPVRSPNVGPILLIASPTCSIVGTALLGCSLRQKSATGMANREPQDQVHRGPRIALGCGLLPIALLVLFLAGGAVLRGQPGSSGKFGMEGGVPLVVLPLTVAGLWLLMFSLKTMFSSSSK